ncbi:hypothetical protein [Agaribacterium sp. ZY112]|uniref:hypothetical protein n=1 Tax=Agaribacterium sp. ZY112 TaxID=3233574 RepID=UPI003523DD33
MIDKSALQSAVKKHLSEKSIRQEDLAKDSGVSQAVVSRAFRADWKHYSPKLRRLGEHVCVERSTADPRESKMLMDALGRLWDGTPEREKLLAELLLNVGQLWEAG